MAGWTERNNDLREGLICNSKADIFCVCETHLSDDQVLVVPDYKWFGHNRLMKHKSAPKTHGGVGIFVKNRLLSEFSVQILDKSYDGILVILFQHIVSHIKFLIICLYLPPENSPWGRQASEFYNYMLHLVYMNSYVDHIFICGDMNS